MIALVLVMMLMMIRVGGIVDVTILRFATHGRDARRDVNARRLLRRPRGRHRRVADCARETNASRIARARRGCSSPFSRIDVDLS